MKLKKIILLSLIAIGLTTLMSTTCDKDDPDEPSGCNGIAWATVTGEINTDFCADQQLHFNYEEGSLIFFGAKQSGDPMYSLIVSVNTYGVTGEHGLLVPGTYQCVYGEAGYIELDMHGEANEYYKSKSGSITITEMSESTFKATFSVVAEGYEGGGTVNISGGVDMPFVNIP